MKQIHKQLTYANVMSSIAVFLVLGGGAYALGRLPRHSVGVTQLKAGAVTAPKLHRNAVTSAKIRYGAVDGGKIADGSITGSDINATSMPFGRVVAKLRGTTSLDLTTEPQVYALNPSSYTQAAEEDDIYGGAVDVSFAAGCEAPRAARAWILVDAADAAALKPAESVVSGGSVEDLSGGSLTTRLEIAPALGGFRFEPGIDKSRGVSVVVRGECATGGGITATAGGVDVIGTR
jgi:hypothetical protein